MAEQVLISNPGPLPVIIFECGTYKQVVIEPSKSKEIELGQTKLISLKDKANYYSNLNGFQGLIVDVDEDNRKATIVNNGDLPVIIFECGTYKQIVIESKETTTVSLRDRPAVSSHEEKIYYMNLNGYQGLNVVASGSILFTVLKAEDDSPIQGATITDSDGKIDFDPTNDKGLSYMTDLFPKKYTLTIAASGYTSKEQEVIVASGEDVELTVKLTVSA